MAYFINFDMKKLEGFAADRGFRSSLWKQELLDDLLFDGQLRVEKAVDLRDSSKVIWYCKGRKAAVALASDRRPDALFCINLVAGPDAGGPRPMGRQVLVPGPWKVAVLGVRTDPLVGAVEHLERCLSPGTARTMPAGQQRQHAPSGSTGGAASTGLPASLAPPASGPPVRTGPKGSAGMRELVERLQADESVGAMRPLLPPGLGRAVVSLSSLNAASSSGSGIVRRPTPVDATPHAAALPSGVTASARVSPRDLSGSPRPVEEDMQAVDMASTVGLAERVPPAPLPMQPSPSEVFVADLVAEAVASGSQTPVVDGADGAPQEIETRAPDPVAAEPSAFSSTPVNWTSLAAGLIVRDHPAMSGILDAREPEEARRQRIARLESELARVQAALAEVPSNDELTACTGHAQRLADLGTRLGASPPVLVRCNDVSDLERLLVLLNGASVRALPDWAVFGAGPVTELVDVLADEALQRRVLTAVSWADSRFPGGPPPLLRELPAPTSPTADVAADLEAAWDLGEALTLASGNLPTACRSILLRVPRGEVGTVARVLGGWQRALSSAAFDELILGLDGASEPASALALHPSLERVDALDEEERENLRDIKTLKRAFSKLQRPAPVSSSVAIPAGAAARRAEPPTGKIMEFSHPVTDEQGRLVSATVFVPAAPLGARYVLLDLPVRVLADSPVAVELVITVTSTSLDVVSRDVVLPAGLRVVTVDTRKALEWTLSADRGRWKALESGRGWAREEVLTVPITLGVARDLRKVGGVQELSLRLTTGGASNQLKFVKFAVVLPQHSAGTGLAEATASELVRNRPLGAQMQHEKLEGVVTEGRHSFMVVAPRRFGKTTLFKHLAIHARAAGHHVVSVPLVREGTPEEGVRRVWADVKRSLEEAFGAAPPLGDSVMNTLDDKVAWGKVRRFVRERGARSLVLLVDEAQVLVPRTGGPRWGHAFKTLIEMDLSEPGDGLAIVQIGLFGTIDLSVRLGQNCRDFLLTAGSAQYDFDEASLARFLRQVGQGAIESTRAARFELARWTNNLRTLSTVFDQIRTRLVSGKRLFMLDSDVDDSIEQMLGAGQQLPEDLWNYARAELSHRDDPWDPIDAFPLAVAWARAEVQELDVADRLAASLIWLNAELRAINLVATIPAERAKEALADLRARGVVRQEGAEFYRPLLRELLRRKSGLLRGDPESQLALMRLAVDTVSWPDGAQERGEGGQAKVFLAEHGGRATAYRACHLETDDTRRGFARTCAAIRTLRDRRTNRTGDEHLPRVSEAGFRADDPSQGVIVYDWVEGETFEAMWGTLPPHGRAHIVKQVAGAVAALHARDVIHCDVAPRNIIVNSKLEATLIDFGLARRTDTMNHTRLPEDQFKAPEQCQEDSPGPVKGSDVFALGALLRGPASFKGVDPFATMTAKLTAPNAEDRPTAEEVVAWLEDHVEFEPGLHQLASKVEDLVTEAPEALWDDLLAYKWQAATASGGFVPWDRHRAMEVAFLLNTIFVRVVSSRRGTVACALADLPCEGDLSLAAVPHKIPQNCSAAVRAWSRSEVRAAGILRIAWAHPKGRKRGLDDARKALGATETNAPAEFKRALALVAKMLDEMIEPGTDVMQRFVQFFGVK